MKPTRDFLVGLTALFGLAGLAVMLVVFGEMPFTGGERYEIVLVLPDAKGIEEDDDITLNGVNVGRVRRTSPNSDPRLGVEVDLAIDEGVRIPRDVVVAVSRDLIGGSRLELTTDHYADAADIPRDDPGFFDPGERFERRALGMIDQIVAMLDERFGSLAGAAQSFEQLSETYIRVGESIERVVSPQGEGGEAIDIGATVAKLDAAIDSARSWLDDDDLRSGARDTIERAGQTLDRLADAVDAWTETAGALSRSADRVTTGFDEGLRGFVDATDELNEALTEIRAVAGRVNQGEGTLGQLLNNPDLYRSLNDAALRLETALREAQLLLEKYRKEGVPIQF